MLRVNSPGHFFILPVSIPPVKNWWMEITAEGGQQSLYTAMPPDLSGGSLLYYLSP